MAKYLKYILCAAICLLFVSCQSRNIRHSVRRLPKGAAITVILNAPERYIEKTQTLFLLAGYSVKAISVFKDEETRSLKSSTELFRMDVYNSEITKAANLHDVRSSLRADYLVIFELGTSKINWGRVIDLRANEIIFISNYMPRSDEDIESVVKYFIVSMTGE